MMMVDEFVIVAVIEITTWWRW